MLFLSMVTLWEQIQNDSLRAVDASTYALIGKELAQKPISDWAILTLRHHEFFEHPHFTPWILGLFIKVFGATTLSALMPIVLISTATVVICYLLGKELWDHSFGILAGTILALTPAFLKDGRNPMLEPALMMWVMLAIYAHLRRRPIFAGLCFGFALLAKGPPALIAPAVMIGFELVVLLFPSSFERYASRFAPDRIKNLFLHFLLVFMTAGLLLGLVDLWHFALDGKSFFLRYFQGQFTYTVLKARGVTLNQWEFYLSNFYEYYPWIFFIYLGAAVVMKKRDPRMLPAFTIGALTTFGIFFGFTLMTHKGFWYTNFHYCSSSLLAALGLRAIIPEFWLARGYTKTIFSISLVTVFLAAAFPTLFYYPRPFESFLENASHDLKSQFQGQTMADCTHLDGYRQGNLIRYYLGAEIAACDAPEASIKLVTIQEWTPSPSTKIIFAQEPYLLISK